MVNDSNFSHQNYVKNIIEYINELAVEPLTIMEVCGTHTMAIAQYGLRQLLPPTLTLVSGPGCPVCVTTTHDIDNIIFLAAQPNTVIATFGDMMKVPGTSSTLEQAKALGSDIRIVYSILDALALAKANSMKNIVFLGVGFETTLPTAAVALEKAVLEQINNFYLYSVYKAVPPVLKYLLKEPNQKINAFLLPGHVSTIIGASQFKFLADTYGCPSVITGFETVDILEGILLILKQHKQQKVKVEIQYNRAVKAEGNKKALAYINQYFRLVEGIWRGIGKIPLSSYVLEKKYSQWDAQVQFKLPNTTIDEKSCTCSAIIKGQKTPYECELFGSKCTPTHPQGPCMISQEGSCAAYYYVYSNNPGRY